MGNNSQQNLPIQKFHSNNVGHRTNTMVRNCFLNSKMSLAQIQRWLSSFGALGNANVSVQDAQYGFKDNRFNCNVPDILRFKKLSPPWYSCNTRSKTHYSSAPNFQLMFSYADYLSGLFKYAFQCFVFMDYMFIFTLVTSTSCLIKQTTE